MKITLQSNAHSVVTGPNGNVYVCETDEPSTCYSIDVAIEHGFLAIEDNEPSTPTKQYVVEHEMDDEPAYINHLDGSEFITIAPGNLELAQHIADALNNKDH